MSDIDFAEIEKAMAELVNKAQGKERAQSLHVAARERTEKAKQIEVAKEQGDIATKRIIVASNNIRSNPHSNSSTPRPVHPKSINLTTSAEVKPQPQPQPNSSGKVMDFKRSDYSTSQSSNKNTKPYISTPPVINSAVDDLNKTVGDLSDNYLLEKVADESNQLPPDEDTQPQNLINIEELTGPAPVMSSNQEPTITDNNTDFVTDDNESNTFAEDEKIPESDQISEEIGKVHKIYGQRLPKEYLQSSNKHNSKNDKNKKIKTINKEKSRKGFTFYFVILMALAAISVWGIAAYLYFVY